MTSCMPDHFSTQAYCDSNSLPREVFSYNNPSVPINTSLHYAMSSPDFRARASACDVGVCGPPCNDTSALNMYRDPHSPTAHLLADSVDAIARHQHKVGVIECPPSIFDPQCQHLLDEVYARSSSHDYVNTMFRISPLDHGGIQTRDRVFIMLTSARSQQSSPLQHRQVPYATYWSPY